MSSAIEREKDALTFHFVILASHPIPINLNLNAPAQNQLD